MTEQGLLEETVAYYHKNPSYRCVDSNNSCRYSGESAPHVSTGCAIGRKMTKENRKELDNISGGGIGIIRAISRHGKLFPKWMRNMDAEFLSEVQSVHDTKANWNEDGLTKYGKASIQRDFIKYDLSFLDKY